MNEEFARHLVRTAFRSSSMLTEIYRMLDEHCEDEVLKGELKASLVKIIADIGYEFSKPITDVFPSIQQEIDQSIEKYGFVIR